MSPGIEPFAHGSLQRPDGDSVFWETSGNPDGEAALYLHGGPGGGLGNGGYRRRFDPDRFLIVGLDQRGCGRSTPWAIDALDRLDDNTTQRLLEDIEALRAHLGVERWLLHGVSWGSSLALEYALAHPQRVTGIVLTAVTSGARSEVDWLTEGVGRLFPEAWHDFAQGALAAGERVVEWYARRLRDPEPSVRSAAADAWDRWEQTHVSLAPGWKPGPLFEDRRERENFATLVTHYWSHDCFLSAPIIDRVHRLSGIPGSLIHGRRDVSSPADTAWELHRRWPDAALHIIDDEGHGGPLMRELTIAEIDRISRLC
ncbi:alpha/beta fold hydrolase [Microbacterium sp. JZ31]|uniref:alpha/beta fold hydrolase n=1 Tax=Microbacterium sp. JZ31 TaxID=1906274 RepID=UPI001EE4431E|nr:alpha/beta fold hydrolase [Microbacterium sp. JZ31]